MDDDIFPPDFGDQLIFIPDNRKRRIQAKADLWEYYNNAFNELIAIQDTTEAVEQLTAEAIRKLHPHYDMKEIMMEMEAIFKSFKLKYPSNWDDTFVLQAFDKAFSNLKNYKGNRDNPLTNFLDDKG